MSYETIVKLQPYEIQMLSAILITHINEEQNVIQKRTNELKQIKQSALLPTDKHVHAEIHSKAIQQSTHLLKSLERIQSKLLGV